MNARRFDPERNQHEIRLLYGDAHADHQIDWNRTLGSVSSTDNRDLRDQQKLGQRILRNRNRRMK